MSRFVSVSGAAWGHGIPISTDGSKAAQQRWAPDQRNPRQQRCSYRVCWDVALYQSAHSANWVIAARVGATTARTWDGRGPGSTPMAPSPDGGISVPRFEGISQACGGRHVIHGRPIAIAWCGTAGGIVGFKEVAVLNRGAHALFRADVPAEAIPFSKGLHGLQGLLTQIKQAVDPAESAGGAPLRRTRRPSTGGGCPRTHDRARWRLLKGSQGCVAIHAGPR